MVKTYLKWHLRCEKEPISRGEEFILLSQRIVIHITKSGCHGFINLHGCDGFRHISGWHRCLGRQGEGWCNIIRDYFIIVRNGRHCHNQWLLDKGAGVCGRTARPRELRRSIADQCGVGVSSSTATKGDCSGPLAFRQRHIRVKVKLEEESKSKNNLQQSFGVQKLAS